MRIIFRVDASEKLGLGHLMRCLTLAEALLRQGCEISFAGNFPDGLKKLVSTRKYRLYSPLTGQSSDFDWEADSEAMGIILRDNKYDSLIVDNYKIDIKWEEKLKHLVNWIMVIDDLANRYHSCSILLDQNYHYKPEKRYQHLIPADCSTFYGPQYALLRPEFRSIRRDMQVRTGEIKRVLISYGGSDPTGETIKVLHGLRLLPAGGFTADVIAGGANSNKRKIRELCKTISWVNYYEQVPNMAEFMNSADICFGAGGATTWERLYLGLPAVVTIVAENQRESINNLAAAGIIKSLGWHEQVRAEDIMYQIEYFQCNQQELREMSSKGLALMADHELCEAQIQEALLYGRANI